MFIDNIKYTLTTLVVALFSLTFVASCGSAESEAHVATDPTSPEEIVPAILHRISGGACDQIPYDICLVAAFFSSRNLQRTGAFEDLGVDNGIFHQSPMSEDVTDTLYQMRNDPVGKIWTKLDRKVSEIDVGLIGNYLLALSEMYLITDEFKNKTSDIQWDWVARHANDMFESVEKCIEQAQQAKARSLEYYMCFELENLVALVFDRGMQHFRSPSFKQQLEEEVWNHRDYVRSLIYEILDLNEQLAQRAY